MLKFADLQRLRLGGTQDNLGLTALGSGALLASAGSPLAGPIGTLLGSIAGAAGGAYFANRLADVLTFETFEGSGSGVKINSSPVPKVTGDFMNLGYLADTGEALNIPLKDFSRHFMITGMNGVGKTVLGSWLFYQQIQRGGGLIFVDGKVDFDNLIMMRNMCAAAGREQDFLVVNFDDPSLSNTYNPVLHGDADEVGSRVMALTPASENNPGTDYYRQAASGAITAIVSGLRASGRAYNPLDIALMLQSEKIFRAVEAMIPRKTPGEVAFKTWAKRFVSIGRDGEDQGLDMKKVRDELGGLVGKIYTFGSGNFGQVCNSYDPEVVLLDAIKQSKIVYITIPSIGKKESAGAAGKMLIGDLRSALGHMQKYAQDRPKIPFLAFFDEAGAYLTNAATTMLEQARSCNISITVAVQTKGNYDQISPDFRQSVTGNTLIKAWFKLNEPDSLEWAEKMIGTERQIDYGVSASRGEGLSRASISNTKARGLSDSSGVGYSESVKEAARVSKNDILRLGQGECIIQYDGDKVYHVKIPLLGFTPEFKAEMGNSFVPNRRRQKRVPGVYAYRIAQEMIDESERNGQGT